MPKKIMIVASLQSGDLFWTGRKWSDEYPDAWLFKTESEAQKALCKINDTFAPMCEVMIEEN